jgi:hypothetical protein
MSLGKAIYTNYTKRQNIHNLDSVFFVLKQAYLVQSSMTIRTCDVPNFSTTTTVPAPALLAVKSSEGLPFRKLQI